MGGVDAPDTPDAEGVARPPRRGGVASMGLVAALVAVGCLLLAAVAAVSARAGDDGGGDAAAADDDGWHGALLGAPQPRPAFTLTDTAGRPYDFAAETQGRLTLLFFGYTSCPDVCPIHMATLAAALREPDMPDPVVVFVSTDPQRDTPERIRTWLDGFSPDIVGLRGSAEEVRAAEVAAQVPPSQRGTGEGDDYEVGHAAQVIAYTPDDRAHVVYPFGVRREDWMADLPRLLDTWGDAAAAAAGDGLTVGGAWASESTGNAAVYLTIVNEGGGDRLVGVRTEAAARPSLMAGGGIDADAHTDHDAGMALDVPTGTTELAPGGTHVMLEQLARPLRPGDRFDLHLDFAGAGERTTTVDVLGWDQVVERLDEAEADAGAAP